MRRGEARVSTVYEVEQNGRMRVRRREAEEPNSSLAGEDSRTGGTDQVTRKRIGIGGYACFKLIHVVPASSHRI